MKSNHLDLAIFLVICFVTRFAYGDDSPNDTTITKLTTQTPFDPAILYSAECPPQSELDEAHCLCYPTMSYLICDGTTSSAFTFTGPYHFNTLVIKNSPQLPFWNEHLTRGSSFKVSRLAILQDTAVDITDNLNELLRLPDDSIKIVSHGTIKSADLSFLGKGMRAISLNGIETVRYNNFAHDYFEDQPRLEHIQFRDVHFSPQIVDIFLHTLPLTYIEFVNAGLKGKFAFIPTVCPRDESAITIRLNQNDLNYFSFALLFPSDEPNCKFHIDLSDNANMDPKLLISQLETLTTKADQLFVVLRDVKLECNCQLYQLYKSKPALVRGVHCKDYGYLDEIDNNPQTLNKICPRA